MANPCEPLLSTTPLAVGDFKLLWLKHVITIINHPPVITINRWYKPFPVMGGLWHSFNHITCYPFWGR